MIKRCDQLGCELIATQTLTTRDIWSWNNAKIEKHYCDTHYFFYLEKWKKTKKLIWLIWGIIIFVLLIIFLPIIFSLN